jgi:hypothetical protein
VALVTGGGVQLVAGVVEVHGRGIRWLLRHFTLVKGGASALTFGHVVLGIDTAALDASRPHERIHVRQYERWGPLLIPAYLLAMFWLLVRRRNAYLDNPFERAAYRQDHVDSA